jgi:hypothetical protein
MTHVGFASKKITPPLGTSLAGYGLQPNRRATGVSDDLYARAVVFDDAAIVVCDIISISKDIVAAARAQIERKAKITTALIAATHSHTAPTASFMRQWGDLEPPYVRSLPDLISDVVAEAALNRKESELLFGTAPCPGVAVNRVHKDGPIDHEVRTLQVKGGTLVNFACHPTTYHYNSTCLSADFPGVMCRHIERETGGFAMFLQGCCGDINPEGFWKGPDYVQRHGTDLAKAALGSKGTPVTGPVRAASTVVHLPIDWEGARQEATDYLMHRNVRKDHEWLLASDFMREWSVETLAWPKQETLATEVQAIAVGDAVFVGLPGEIYTFVSQAIRKRSPFAHTWTLGYANDNIGYVPEPRDYQEGTYAAYMTPKLYGFLTFRPNVGEVLIGATHELLSRLR